MKTKNLKYILEFFFKQLFILFVLSCPIIVNWACETENTILQNCQNSTCYRCDHNMSLPWDNCNNCSSFIWCDLYEEAYLNCIAQQNTGQGQWGQQTPPAWQCEIQPDGSWNCLLWYKNVSNCCVLACEGTGYLSGVVDWQYICESCIPGETKPNESHTRCICDPDFKCCGVQLNNVIPFIWDCIEMNAESNRDNTTNVNSVTAFPILMQWLMKILMSVIMIFSFLMIIVAWLMIVSWAFGWNWFATGKKIIKNVIISLILLGCSWLILSLINPSFFGW